MRCANMRIRPLIWLFPWLMAVLEFLLRASATNAEAVAFIGPTVGGAALGMLLPATLPETPGDGKRAQGANVILWIGLTAWACSLYLGINRGSPYFPDLDGVRTSFLIGSIIWLCAVIADLVAGVRK